MPRSLADGRHKVVVSSTKPANWPDWTLAELAAATDISCSVMSSGYKLGASASDTVDEPALCDEGGTKVMTKANFEGELPLFRYFDETGKADPDEDKAWQSVKARGATVWIGDRFTSKKSAEPFAVGDEIGSYEVVPDHGQNAEATGYIKKIVPLQVNGNSDPNAEVVAGP